MKKTILSLTVLFSFGAYVLWQNTVNSSSSLPSDNLTSFPEVGSATTSHTSSSKSTSQNKSISGIYKDGEYVGPSVYAYYGNLQVKAIISGGKLVDVQFLDYPHDRGNSIRINSRALPILKQEAIKAQSAKVNAVSGASETSPAFVQSLTSALNQAKV